MTAVTLLTSVASGPWRLSYAGANMLHTQSFPAKFGRCTPPTTTTNVGSITQGMCGGGGSRTRTDILEIVPGWPVVLTLFTQ